MMFCEISATQSSLKIFRDAPEVVKDSEKLVWFAHASERPQDPYVYKSPEHGYPQDAYKE